MDDELTPVGVWVSNLLELLLCGVKETGEFTRVAYVAVTLELDTDLDCAVTEDVTANVPVECVAEVASVERLDVGGVCGAEGRRCGSVAQEW